MRASEVSCAHAARTTRETVSRGTLRLKRAQRAHTHVVRARERSCGPFHSKEAFATALVDGYRGQVAAHTKLLVVRPKGEAALTPSKSHLEELVRTLLGTRELSMVEKVARSASPLIALLTALPGRLRGKVTPAQVDDAMPVLVELVRRLIEGHPELIDPELQVLTEASSELDRLRVLGDASFFTNVVYAMHPHAPGAYVRLAHFHRYLLDDKRAEFERIAASLGAREIRMIERATSASEGAGGATVSVPTSAGVVDVGGKGLRRAASDEHFSLEASFAKPASAPSLPPGLRWLPSEPQWQALVDARVGDTTLTRRRVTFRYASDYAIHAALAAKLQGVGLSCGGTFEEMRSVELDYLVEFHPR